MPGDKSTSTDAHALLIDLGSHEATPMQELALSDAGLRERDDLQRWVTEHPELIALDLLLITTEFDRWEIQERNVYDRLDALFLDGAGAPVVVEFKRDRATDTVELQALKYAAYCSQLTFDELIEEYAGTNDFSTDEAKQKLLDHAPVLEEGALGAVRIVLVAGSFGPAVTSVVLWLRENGIDIGCLEVTARAVPGATTAVLSSRQIIPLPEAEDYLVRRRRKEQEHEATRAQPIEASWEGYAKQFPDERVAVAKVLWDSITRYVGNHDLPWTPALRSWWLGYTRGGGYYVTTISLRVEKPIEYNVKLPAGPDELGLENPYPQLETRWDAGVRQWAWLVPTLADVPDVAAAIDISRASQPEKGPMKAP